MTTDGGDPPPAAAAVPVIAPGLHGKASAFDPQQEDWIEYVERLELYFMANNIENLSKKRAIFLNAAGPSTYRLVKTLAIPGKPTDLSFDEIVEKVKTHFHPKPSPIIKRFEFNMRKQKIKEAVSEYVASLRRIAEHCEYGATLDEMLRDHLVCEIADKRVQNRYLRESKLTYADALSMALAAETAVKDSRKLHSKGDDDGATPFEVTHEEESTVQQINRDRTPRSRFPRRRLPTPQKGSATGHEEPQCHRCGGKHNPTRCRFRDYDCHYCKKKGHLAAVCRKKKQADKAPDSEQAKRVKVVPSRQEDQEYTMYHVSGQGSTKPLIADVTLNGISTAMEIDTGASVSLMGEVHFKPLREKGAILRQSNAKLSTYTGETIPVLGISDVKVEHNGQTLTLPLVVIPGNGPPLLGRDWLTTLQLNWESIFRVNTQRSLQDVL